MHITSNDLVLYFGLLLTILNIIDRSSILKAKANAPQKELEARVALLEEDSEQFKRFFANDDRRIVSLEEGGRVLIKAMGSLLSHGIDGNNIQEMRDSRDEINDYLIHRK